MKKNLTRMLGLGALATGMIFAQASSDSGQLAKRPEAQRSWRESGHGQRRARFANRIANYLNLSPEQRTQAKQVLANAREEAKPLRRQLHQNRAALLDAIKAGDNARIDQITKGEAPLMAQMAAIRAHAFSKIYATLTPEQKTKADNMRQFMSHRRMHQRTAQTNG